MKKLNLILIALLPAIYSAGAFASSSSLSEKQRVNLHDKSTASSEYERYLSDKSNQTDPFDKVREGYNVNYSKDVEDKVQYDKSRKLDSLLEQQSSSLKESLSGNSEARKTEKSRLYQQYSSEEGVNSDQYNAGMNKFNANISNAEAMARQQRYEDMNKVLSSSNTGLKSTEQSSYTDSKAAAQNLISVMNAKNDVKVQEVQGSFTSAQNSTPDYNVNADNAKYQASLWDQDCGDACTLPTPPPPPVPPVVEDPWKDVRAGCYVSTKNLDKITRGGCNSYEWRTLMSPPKIIFSVGNVIGRDNYIFSDSNIKVSWSGDCTSSGSQCVITGPCQLKKCEGVGSKKATAMVTMNGETKKFIVTGLDRTKMMSEGGGVIER